MLESVSSKCKKLQSYIKELNNAEQKSHQNGSTLVRPEFSQAQVQRIIQDRFILLATYEGKHNDGAFHDLLKSSSCTPEESMGQLHENDTSFKLGVGCGLLYLIAASKNELGKMVELREEMETFLQKVKGELQSKDALLKPLKQSDALALSMTDIQEVSSSNSHLSIHSQTQYVQPELECDMIRNHFLEYNLNEQDERAEEINELHAEFEIELQRLQLYLDGEAAFEDAQQKGVKVTGKDSSSKSHSSSIGEIIMEPQGASYDVSFGVPPVELERRLHELLEARLKERISELESALECATQKLIKKEIEVTWWKETARLISQHVPETSRFTFPLDPEMALKLSQAVG
uniref:Protein POLAR LOCALIZATION DURING ASYMMETRIC DIVISION AND REDISTRIBUTION n=1 Tax=Cajanus cajan TaxID=3821 RepID=A0A151RNW9_CAJCA|nr:hypothetical protein KK1_034301 [Cajanus cajan]